MNTNFFFQFLIPDNKQSKILLMHLTSTQKNALVKMAKGVLKGQIPLKKPQVNRLKEHSGFLRKLSNGKVKSGASLRSNSRAVSLMLKYSLKNEKLTKTSTSTSGRLGTIKRKNITKCENRRRPSSSSSDISESDDEEDNIRNEPEDDDNTFHLLSTTRRVDKKKKNQKQSKCEERYDTDDTEESCGEKVEQQDSVDA
jgi:hypothetical protein